MNIRNSPARDRTAANAPVTPSRPAQLSPGLQQRLAKLAGSTADQVSLSNFSAALKATDSGSPQQTARLAALSAAAANRSYRIDAPAVSESIINQHFRA